MIMPKEPINQDLTHINHHTPEKTRNLQSFESPIIDSNISNVTPQNVIKSQPQH